MTGTEFWTLTSCPPLYVKLVVCTAIPYTIENLNAILPYLFMKPIVKLHTAPIPFV